MSKIFAALALVLVTLAGCKSSTHTVMVFCDKDSGVYYRITEEKVNTEQGKSYARFEAFVTINWKQDCGGGDPVNDLLRFYAPAQSLEGAKLMAESAITNYMGQHSSQLVKLDSASGR